MYDGCHVRTLSSPYKQPRYHALRTQATKDTEHNFREICRLKDFGEVFGSIHTLVACVLGIFCRLHLWRSLYWELAAFV